MRPFAHNVPALLAAGATTACRACIVERRHRVCCVDITLGVAVVLGGWLAARGQEEGAQESAVQLLQAAAGHRGGGEGRHDWSSTACSKLACLLKITI